MSQSPNNFRELASRIVALQVKARALGMFTNDRELLECRECGLLEDVTINGLLITCRAPDFGQDMGLHFEKLFQGQFRCPACGSMIQAD
jgi:hypothetical protein